MKQLSKSLKGFTLIEFGVAIAIIGVLGVSAGQMARFNLLFLPAVQFGLAPAQCTVDLKIYDDTGASLAASTVTLTGNQSKNVTYENTPSATTGPAPGSFASTGSATADPTAVEIHAFATVPDCPDHSESCSPTQRLQQQACANNPRDFAATLELVDASGNTLALLPAVQLPAEQFPGFRAPPAGGRLD